MNEFDLIDSIAQVLRETAAAPSVVLGPGDDAAVVIPPQGHELVVSTDTLVAGRHYPEGAQPDAIGYRGMAVAVSDLAAMGAAPAWAVVALTTPRLEEDWARRFAGGVRGAARDFGLAVIGGNLARGPQSVTVTAHGHLPSGTAIRRAGARPGDIVHVTGTLGGAGLALADRERLRECSLADLVAGAPEHRFWKPAPRLALGVALRGFASAGLDISDGLASDLEHLCRASGVACEVDLARLPTFPGCDPLAAVSAGDDYELAFTAPPRHACALRKLAAETGVPITPVGTVRAMEAGGAELHRARWLRGGVAVRPRRGFAHF